MDHREKEALDRWITREQPTVAECPTCGGAGWFSVALTDEPRDDGRPGPNKDVECPECGGTGDAPIVEELEYPSEGDYCDKCGKAVPRSQAKCPACGGPHVEACEGCGAAVAPDDRGEDGLGGWQHVEEYGDAPFHAACLAERRVADEREAREIEAAWQRDPVAQAEEWAARAAAGDIQPPDLDPDRRGD